MFKLSVTKPRLHHFQRGKYVVGPTDVLSLTEEDAVSLVDEDRVVRHMLETGDVIIRDREGNLWSPKGTVAMSKDSKDVSPVVTFDNSANDKSEPREVPKEVKPEQIGGGVPGQSIKECREEVAGCNNMTVLADWLDAEKRKKVKQAIEDRMSELSSLEANAE